MLFNSLKFIFVFLPITMLGFQLLGRYGRRPVIAWLAAMSVVFYAAWNKFYVLFLIGSILVNYLVAYAIGSAPEASARRKRLLTFGIFLNLLALFYFKYLYKLLLTIKALHLANLNPHPILLPLGISFFTFTQISYLVDLAQGQAECQDFFSYLLFVTFFPHLIAGPILHHKEMMPQFGSTPPEGQQPAAGNPQFAAAPSRRFALRAEDVSLGMTWFLMGLAKKVLIADRLAPTADIAFHNAGSLSAANAWTGLVVYSMQLYFDFSGYSDMALGLARIFSIRFPLNFDSPYKATSVTEYWQRWHMTLTRYITLYLYNPILLSVQRHRVARGKKTSRKALATVGGFTSLVAYPTMFTMLLTGIWHGAGLQFVVFGLIHGVYLTANQAWRHFRQRASDGAAQARRSHPPAHDVWRLPAGNLCAHLLPFRVHGLRLRSHRRHVRPQQSGPAGRARCWRHGLRTLSRRLVLPQHPAAPRTGDRPRRHRGIARHAGRQSLARPNSVSRPPLASEPRLGHRHGRPLLRLPHQPRQPRPLSLLPVLSAP